MGIPEKIKQIEEEMRRTQINKATERHLGVLKARMARLRDELEEQAARKSGGGDGYSVKKGGDATVVLLGFPSVGKSTLLNHLTNSNSKVGAYDFTTLTVVPGMLDYNGARIQILDIPGIIKGASRGRGLGKRILSTTRSADLIIVVLEVFNPNIREVLLDEIRAIGLRPDERVPDVVIRKRGSGGISITDMVGMTKMHPDGIKDILREYKHHNARVIVREDVTYDQFIDVMMKNRVYVPTLTVLNKIDMVDGRRISEVGEACGFDFLPISADNDVNLDRLKELIFEELDLIKLYMKPRGEEPDFDEPLIIRNGSTIEDVSDRVHRKLKDELRYTRVWGKSVKHGGQKVGLTHCPMDEDIITFFT
ncbi:GTP-binding protein [Candidatus Bathyarchaeota archaeon]|nr:GTP-binding protein [Candidatus Bathyarchaeota archaeon]